jgi:glycosyltransferase involved in cell wall biosynthesis
MINPRVTILIPTYNRGHLIGKTIEDCFKQTVVDFKIVIYDDASTDNTNEIVNVYIKKYGKEVIQYYKGGINKGIGHARNVLLKLLDTEFGIWLDSDDLMSKYRIEKCISYMNENQEIDIIYSDIRWFSEGKKISLGNHINIDVTRYNKNDWSSLKFNTACATGFFKSSLSKFKFEESLKLGGEDVLWIWLLLQNDIKIGHIDEYLYLYRNHTERIGKQKRQESMKELKEKEDAILALKIKEIQNDKS